MRINQESETINNILNTQEISDDLRHDWQESEILELFALPFNDLIFKAAQIHRQNHNPNQVQVSTLLSIKTGSCPEDCKYCPQSAHYNTGLKKEPFMELEKVVNAAKAAKEAGASRFCMGAAWRNLHDRDLDKVCDMVKEVKKLGLESCVTLGMINEKQSKKLKDAGLDYYNHNIDTSPEYYKEIISTRSFEDRLETLKNVRESGIKTCSGGIVGMGESKEDRAKMLMTLANLPTHPHSVPINMLVKVKGTPLENSSGIDEFDFIRTIAIARIMMPKSFVRLSAGREEMNEQTQALCFFAGANSIFYGEKLLTTANPEAEKDQKLFAKLGIQSS
ncbi:MAG: biotin synthase BioB [Proteobacteria bacterium]|nr:biotin synthase BioB [Pseudomonadota bacterium]